MLGNRVTMIARNPKLEPSYFCCLCLGIHFCLVYTFVWLAPTTNVKLQGLSVALHPVHTLASAVDSGTVRRQQLFGTIPLRQIYFHPVHSHHGTHQFEGVTRHRSVSRIDLQAHCQPAFKSTSVRPRELRSATCPYRLLSSFCVSCVWRLAGRARPRMRLEVWLLPQRFTTNSS